MMRKKVVFTRNPACAPFFFRGYSQNPIFKKGVESVDVYKYTPVTAMRMAHAHGTRVRRRHPRPSRRFEAPDQARRSIEPKICRSW